MASTRIATDPAISAYGVNDRRRRVGAGSDGGASRVGAVTAVSSRLRACGAALRATGRGRIGASPPARASAGPARSAGAAVEHRCDLGVVLLGERGDVAALGDLAEELLEHPRACLLYTSDAADE